MDVSRDVAMQRRLPPRHRPASVVDTGADGLVTVVPQAAAGDTVAIGKESD